MGKVKVTVDLNRCVGSQLCMMFSPAVFERNEHGQSRVYAPDAADEKELLATAEQCPQCAIRVEDTESGKLLFPPPELDF